MIEVNRWRAVPLNASPSPVSTMYRPTRRRKPSSHDARARNMAPSDLCPLPSAAAVPSMCLASLSGLSSADDEKHVTNPILLNPSLVESSPV
jgi:hypothetical protein